MQGVLDFFDSCVTFIKDSFDGFIMFIQGVFSGDWEKAWQGIQKAFQAVWDFILRTLDGLWKFVDEFVIQPIINSFNWLWEGITAGVNGTWQFIVNIFNGIGSFFTNIVSDIVEMFRNIGSKVGDAVGGALKTAINTVLNVVEGVLNTPIRAINGLLDIINAVPGINLGKLNTFNLPRLKTGAIINMPNKGAYVGGGRALAGEAGREGIVPLTDEQAMSELGREIGRNVVINLTNINTMNGRVISRELKTIQNEQDFAFNA